MQRSNLVSGGVLVVFSLLLIFWLIPAQVETGDGDPTMSPRLMPYVCAIALLGLSALLVFGNLRGLSEKGESPFTKQELMKMGLISLTIAVSALLFVYVHAIAAGIVVVVGVLAAMGERHPLPYIAIPVVLLLGVYLLFYQLLGTAIE